MGERGKRKRVYRQQDYQTPFEKLSSLAGWASYLREGQTECELKRRAMAHSDTEFARLMQQHKRSLLRKARAG